MFTCYAGVKYNIFNYIKPSLRSSSIMTFERFILSPKFKMLDSSNTLLWLRRKSGVDMISDRIQKNKDILVLMLSLVARGADLKKLSVFVNVPVCVNHIVFRIYPLLFTPMWLISRAIVPCSSYFYYFYCLLFVFIYI